VMAPADTATVSTATIRRLILFISASPGCA
jgi:hypothetical protein